MPSSDPLEQAPALIPLEKLKFVAFFLIAIVIVLAFVAGLWFVAWKVK